MRTHRIYTNKTGERVSLEPFYDPSMDYDPKKDAEKIYEFLQTLPPTTLEALKRRIFRDIDNKSLDSLLNISF